MNEEIFQCTLERWLQIAETHLKNPEISDLTKVELNGRIKALQEILNLLR